MTDEQIMEYMLQSAYKKSMFKKFNPPEVKNDISEKEALQIFNELIEVFRKHNLSYRCSTRISMALNEAMITGAVELYDREIP